MRIVITGGSRGIGKSIAEAALNAGYSVHLVARDEARLRATVRELNALGSVTCSMLDVANADLVLPFCQQWNGELYGLVNNAGYWLEDPIDELDPQAFSEMLRVNLIAPYILTKALLPRIRGPGRIVNIASQLGTQGRARMGAYSATKHGLVGLTKCWAPEVAERGITVNAVCPGWVNTESNRVDLRRSAADRQTTLEHEMRAISSTLTLRRFIEPKEVADLVLFLLSAKASGITGQVYEIK